MEKLRLTLGIISIIIGILFGLIAVIGCMAFSLTGPVNGGGRGFLLSLVFLGAGIFAVVCHDFPENFRICACIYGLGVLMTVWGYCDIDGFDKDELWLYGIISIVFAGIFLFSSCRSWKAALISAFAILALAGLSMLIIELDKNAKRKIEQKAEAEAQERWQSFLNRTPEEIAQDYLAYYSGISRKQLVSKLEWLDGMEHPVAEQVADSVHEDWKKRAFAAACNEVIKENAGDLNFLDDESITLGIDKENVAYKLAEMGFEEEEIAWALHCLDMGHIRDYKKTRRDSEVSDLDSFGKYYHDYLIDSSGKDDAPDPYDTSLAFLDISIGEMSYPRHYSGTSTTFFTVEAACDGPANVIAIPRNADAVISLNKSENAGTSDDEIVIKVISANGQKRKNSHIRIVKAEDRADAAGEPDSIPQSLKGVPLSGKAITVAVLDIPEGAQVPKGYMRSSVYVNGKNVKGWVDTSRLSPQNIVVYGMNGRSGKCLYFYDFAEKTLQRWFQNDGTAKIAFAGKVTSSGPETVSDAAKLYGKALSVTVLDPGGLKEAGLSATDGCSITEITVDGVKVKGFVSDDIASPEYIEICVLDDSGVIYSYCYDIVEKTLQKNYSSSGYPINFPNSLFGNQ